MSFLPKLDWIKKTANIYSHLIKGLIFANTNGTVGCVNGETVEVTCNLQDEKHIEINHQQHVLQSTISAEVIQYSDNLYVSTSQSFQFILGAIILDETKKDKCLELVCSLKDLLESFAGQEPNQQQEAQPQQQIEQQEQQIEKQVEQQQNNVTEQAVEHQETEVKQEIVQEEKKVEQPSEILVEQPQQADEKVAE